MASSSRPSLNSAPSGSAARSLVQPPTPAASSSRPSLNSTPSPSAARSLMSPPTPGGTIVTAATFPSTIAPPTTPGSARSTASGTAVKWADQKLGPAASKTKGHVASGAAKMVGWTHDKFETATSAKGLRPMHVRVSVRVHHVAFLHPGLDNGGRATIRGRSGKWRFAKKDKASPPGLLQFGKKKGDWKNPTSSKSKSSSEDSGGDKNAARMAHPGKEDAAAMDASEISEIISAEAFRLSRDGIIQHHHALHRGAASSSSSRSTPPTPPNESGGDLFFRGDVRAATSAPKSSARSFSSTRNPQEAASRARSSAQPAANPQDAARYYRECAARPKGYRRLVVSSAYPAGDVPAAPPPPPPPPPAYGKQTSRSMSRSTRRVGDAPSRRGRHDWSDRRASSWAFESSDTIGDSAEGKKKNEEKNENLFNNVEYQYIGPPQTGPEFFQLLRAHGAATFGRYLPELACSVPKHSVGFELRRQSKPRQRLASTQPLVVEAPHLVWGDARDKMLGRIAQEGCPLIDSRGFEYVTNAALEETELSESLMVCGATLWVENAPEDHDHASPSKLMSPHAKGMVKAEYYTGKIVDGVAEGLGFGAKGLFKGTRETAHVVKEGAKKGAHGVKHLTGTSTGGDSPSTTQVRCEAPDEGEHKKGRKRDKLKKMFNPKKVANKVRQRSKVSADSTRHSALVNADDDNDESSVEGEGAATDSMHAADTLVEHAADEGFDTNVGEDKIVKIPKDKSPKKEAEMTSNTGDFTVVQPVPYVLLLDDIIDIRIVSFPDKNDLIAEFPISVASVMAQRNIEDRINDPLKPSELTATLIQEPNAQELRWGVELKVTLRAVEVHPNIPKVVHRPKDIIDDEMHKMKERLKLLGKKPEEIMTELRAKEEETVKEENDLNMAIVAYGYGKGDNQGAGQNEVRHRQMFYCDREHVAIARKLKRRTSLNEYEKKMILDAMIDPPDLERDRDNDYEQKMLALIDLNFPGIEKEIVADNGLTPLNAVSASGISPTKEDETTNKVASLSTVSAAGISGISPCTDPVATSTKDEFCSTSHGTLAKASLAMAQSLDNCLGGLMDKPTVPAVYNRLSRTFTEGMESPVTRSVAKEWCSQVAEKVSRVSKTDAPVKSSIANIQRIIAESALGPEVDFEDSVIDTEGEMKQNEDEIALLKADSESDDLDSSKMLEWIHAVSSQLEAYAEELDDDDQELLASSETLNAIAEVDRKKAGSSIIGLSGVLSGPSASRLGRGISDRCLKIGLMIDDESEQTPSVESPCKNDPDGELWDSVLSRKDSSKSARPYATSISSVKAAMPRSLNTMNASDPDGELWDSVLSRKESSKSVGPLSKSSLRFRNATSISTVEDALLRSQTEHTEPQTEPLSRMIKESHGQSHHINMRTTSSYFTLVYLALIATVLTLCGVGLYQVIWFLVNR